jgi:hypothetical protein
VLVSSKSRLGLTVYGPAPVKPGALERSGVLQHMPGFGMALGLGLCVLGSLTWSLASLGYSDLPGRTVSQHLWLQPVSFCGLLWLLESRPWWASNFPSTCYSPFNTQAVSSSSWELALEKMIKGGPRFTCLNIYKLSIKPTNLNKICSILQPWQFYLQNDKIENTYDFYMIFRWMNVRYGRELSFIIY